MITGICPLCGEVILTAFLHIHLEDSCKENRVQVRSTATSTCFDKTDKSANSGNISRLSLKRKRTPSAPSLNTQEDLFAESDEIEKPSEKTSCHVSEWYETLSRNETQIVERKSSPSFDTQEELFGASEEVKITKLSVIPSSQFSELNETFSRKETKIIERKPAPSLNTQEELFLETEEVKKPSKRKSCHVSEKNEAVLRQVEKVRVKKKKILHQVEKKKKVVTVSIKNRTGKCYVLEHFNFVLKRVLADPNESCLFNEWDKQILYNFFNLSDDAKKLYGKMNQRKFKWNRVSKVRCLKITTDVNLVVEELFRAELFDTEPMDLEILDELTVPELRTILHLLKLNRSLTVRKSIMIDIINKNCREQGTIFPNIENLHQIVIQKAKKILGPCFRVSECRRRVINRAFLLFSLTSYYPADNSKTLGNPALFTLLSVNSSKTVYPKYTTLKEAKIFRNRDDLIRYELFDQAEQEMISLSASKDWDALLTLYQFCKENYTTESGRSLQHVLELPEYLIRYSSNAAWIRCQNIAVSALERLGRFEEASVLLTLLLAQKSFYLHKRGEWMVRLSSNLHKYLQKSKESLIVVVNGLQDDYVLGKDRLSLYLGGLKIVESQNNQNSEFKTLIKKFHTCIPYLIRDFPTNEIKGRLLPYHNPGQRSTFVSNDDFGCSAEDLAINHYKEVGYTEGLYGESRIFASIFALIFWDIIYKDGIPDVFRSPFQIYPLDLNTPLFYGQRRVEIDEKLHWISATSRKNICHTIEETWKLHFGELSLVDWYVFTGVEQLQSLIMCINRKTLSLICGRFAKDYRHNRSELPGLVVWNETEKKFKVVEVKGPTDKVSPQQMVWLDFLIEIGIDAELCYVLSVDDDDATQLKDDDDAWK